MPPDDIDNCTQVLGLRIRPSERKVLDERAGDKSITAYVRQQLGLDEAPPKGRRWPADPALRQWRKST